MKLSLIQTIKNNHSYLRYLEHEIIRNIIAKGEFIDLGAKSDAERYYDYLDMSNVTEAHFCDIISSSSKVKTLNLEKSFDLDSESYDTVIYFNVLEHIYNYKNLIQESHRILKKDGRAHVIVPFMFEYHGDPDDFNRFTHTALYRKYTDAGFSAVRVTPIGPGRFNVIGMYLSTILKNKFYKILIISICRFLQKFENLFIKSPNRFCLAYYVEAEK